MTDIQRHLKGIRKIFAQALTVGAIDHDAVRRELRAFLPRSYGIGSGVIITAPQGESLPVSLLLYDVPHAQGIYDDSADRFHIEHVLCVLDVTHTHTTSTFAVALERIASVKRLQTSRKRDPHPISPMPPGQARRIVPKDRLPFAWLYFDHLEGESAEGEEFFACFYEPMRHTPLEYLPDQVDAVGQAAQYVNPLLETDPARRVDSGWSRLPDLRQPDVCYGCKSRFFRQHFFYDQLCLRCGDRNYHKRVEQADLRGYTVLVTGGRVKIGYATVLRLLRAGAQVITTSRFPHDTARRYAEEPDSAEWRDRLHVYALDLRQIPRVEAFAHHLERTYPHLDAIINNAAQTVKRPPAFYAHLLPYELSAELPQGVRMLLSGEPASLDHFRLSVSGYLPGESDPTFPPGQLDAHGQQIDNREFNSWVMRLEDVPSLEMVEVQLVNAVAPAVLAGQLKGMLIRSLHPARFIVNVAAAEGRFSQYKNGFHPHTNMAKAALNMLTRTVADDYAASRIYVTSVDPGWVSDQAPRRDDVERSEGDARLPIDMIDAAARICDPLFSAINGTPPVYGTLIKDYQVVEW